MPTKPTQTRADGRNYSSLRPMTISYGIMPSATGSALFTINSSSSTSSNASSSLDSTSVICGVFGPTVVSQAPGLNQGGKSTVLSLHGGDLKIDVKVKLEGTPMNVNVLIGGAFGATNAEDLAVDDFGVETGTSSSSNENNTMTITPPTTMMEKEISSYLASIVAQMLSPPTTSINPKGPLNDQITRWYDPGSTLFIILKVVTSPSSSPILSPCINALTCALLDTAGAVRMRQTLLASCILVLDEDDPNDDSVTHQLVIDPTMNEALTPNSTVLTIVTSQASKNVISLQTERFAQPALTVNGTSVEEVGISAGAMVEVIENASKVVEKVREVVRRSITSKNGRN